MLPDKASPQSPSGACDAKGTSMKTRAGSGLNCIVATSPDTECATPVPGAGAVSVGVSSKAGLIDDARLEAILNKPQDSRDERERCDDTEETPIKELHTVNHK